MNWKKTLWAFLILFFSVNLFAANEDNVLNLYMWSGIISTEILKKFEKETGIKVNYSTFENNEGMYTKLRANKHSGYDLIEPSTYYIDRMRRLGMLEKIDKHQLKYYHNLNPEFLNHTYDPHNDYSIPLDWGVTGIIVNKAYYDPSSLHAWTDLWDKRFSNELMLIDDSREVFSIALLTLGYSANDNNPEHIKEAYLKLKALMPNVKIFNSEAIISVLVDEDATIGMAWNGDAFRANSENNNLQYIYPKEGFVIFVDNLAIPENAPHVQNAYRFLNFVMRADIARDIALFSHYPTPNLAGQRLLPEKIRNNPIIYPPHSVLAHGQYQMDISNEALAAYEKYWGLLKMGG